MIKNTKFYVGLTLIVQSVSYLILLILLFVKKKSIAGALLAVASIGGLVGSWLVLKQLDDTLEKKRINNAIDDLCCITDDEEISVPETMEIPIDDTVNEDEFRN